MKNKKDIFYKRPLFSNWGELFIESNSIVDQLYYLNINIDLLRNCGHHLVNVKKWQDNTDDAFDISVY